MKNILISGGKGNLAKEILKANDIHNIFALSKDKLNVYNLNQLDKVVKKLNPDIFIHTAALTRPMIKHIESPDSSIRNNIIGTSNVVLTCIKYNIKLIYISTDYVYPCTKGNYTEDSTLFPVNEYAWSKLGGECAVKLYKNSLILRMALCQKPFPHPKALVDVKKSYLFMDKAAKVILKLINKKGTINVGGNPLSPYEFIKKSNPNIKKIYLNEIKDVNMGVDVSMNIDKLNKILNND